MLKRQLLALFAINLLAFPARAAETSDLNNLSPDIRYDLTCAEATIVASQREKDSESASTLSMESFFWLGRLSVRGGGVNWQKVMTTDIVQHDRGDDFYKRSLRDCVTKMQEFMSGTLER